MRTVRLAASPLPITDLIVAVLRMACATGSAILRRHAKRLPADAVPAHFAAGLDMMRALPPDSITRPDAIGIVLDKPALSTRLAVWRHLSNEPPPPILTTQRLTPGEIALVA